MAILPEFLLVRRVALSLLWLMIVAHTGKTCRAQVIDATQWKSGMVDLNDGWKEHDGDNPAWAQSAYNDREWQTVDLDGAGAARPGWKWYRLTVELGAAHPPERLLIEGGDGTYELYVDGHKVGGPKLLPFFQVKRPIERVVAVGETGPQVVLAFRTFAGREYTEWHLPLFLVAQLGTPEAIDMARATLESQRLYAALPSIAFNLLLLLAGSCAFALYWTERSRSEYLWLGLYLLLLGLSNLLVSCSVTGVISLGWNNLLGDPLIYLFTIMQIQFTFSFAGHRLSRIWRVYQVLLLAMLIPAMLTSVAVFSSSLYVLLEALSIFPAALLLPVVLFVWYRGGNREAGWLILPSLLPAATTAISDLGTVSIFTGWGHADFLASWIQLGPTPVQTADLGDLLFVLSIGVVMFFRFTRVSREQARSAAELEAGRNMQSLMVPIEPPSTPGFAVESVYVPASEVGGDFFQVLPDQDGSLLIVVGDVSGKGLKAAMTVSIIVGALRSECSRDPARVLTNLNRLLHRQISGFVTCCATLINADGRLRLANAGHLPPYRNGEEIECEAVLPLGLTADGAYMESTLLLAPHDQLTFVSDGVVEAMNSKGELFGFDRTRGISGQAAHVIGQAAQQFGQNDDITVLTVVFAGAKALQF